MTLPVSSETILTPVLAAANDGRRTMFAMRAVKSTIVCGVFEVEVKGRDVGDGLTGDGVAIEGVGEGEGVGELCGG